MRAMVYEKYGNPEVLQLKELDKPKPKDNDLLIKVKATTVNRTDCANLSAKPFIMRFSLGLFRPKKSILGTEFAGIVEEVGVAVQSFIVGDKVFGFDDSIAGSYADYMTIREDQGVATMPRDLSYKQAAASIEGAHYAYNFLNKVPIKKGDRVMVNGASGGIGSATIQLLKYHCAKVTAVCDTKNIALLKSLGADKVIDYLKEDFTQDDEKYDYVFDSVGKSTFGKCKRLLKPGGIYISSELGPWIQNIYFSLISAIFGSMPFHGGRKVRFPYPPNILRTVLFIKKLIDEKRYQSVIDRTYPLEEIADAFRYVAKGQKTGNVVITLA
jgi:NADPH:quinone reductase-like Zn-dependent oxidoreductase